VLPAAYFCPINRGLAFLKTAGAALFSRLLGLTIALFGFYSFFTESTSHVAVINRELGISGDEFTNEQVPPTRDLATTCGRLGV
jgi:hypothetical protein